MSSALNAGLVWTDPEGHVLAVRGLLDLDLLLWHHLREHYSREGCHNPTRVQKWQEKPLPWPPVALCSRCLWPRDGKHRIIAALLEGHGEAPCAACQAGAMLPHPLRGWVIEDPYCPICSGEIKRLPMESFYGQGAKPWEVQE